MGGREFFGVRHEVGPGALAEPIEPGMVKPVLVVVIVVGFGPETPVLRARGGSIPGGLVPRGAVPVCPVLRFVLFPGRDRVGQFAASVAPGAPVLSPPGTAVRAPILGVVGLAADLPGVSGPVPQMRGFIARTGRFGVRRFEVTQVRPGLVAVGTGCRRIG
ncbi:hypothetical protein GCM10029992_14460 [Glycomyces albus]